jgi:hypothetical protein
MTTAIPLFDSAVSDVLAAQPDRWHSRLDVAAELAGTGHPTSEHSYRKALRRLVELGLAQEMPNVGRRYRNDLSAAADLWRHAATSPAVDQSAILPVAAAVTAGAPADVPAEISTQAPTLFTAEVLADGSVRMGVDDLASLAGFLTELTGRGDQ